MESKVWIPQLGETVEYLTGKLGVRHVERGRIVGIHNLGTGKPFSIKYLINGKWRYNIQPVGSCGFGKYEGKG